MNIQNYLEKNPVAMIALELDNNTFQYNYWNLVRDQLVLLRDDFTIGHILLLTDSLIENSDGSFNVSSSKWPKKYKINMYLGGISQ